MMEDDGGIWRIMEDYGGWGVWNGLEMSGVGSKVCGGIRGDALQIVWRHSR